MNLPLPPELTPNRAGVPDLPAFWHAVALCTPFDGGPVTVAEVWLDSVAGAMRVLQCRLDGAYLDLLFTGTEAWLLDSVDAGPPRAIIGPFSTDCRAPRADWFSRQGLRSPGSGPLLGVTCDWWVGLTTCRNQANPDNPPAPVDQVANWFWFRSDSGLPLQMMFINQDNDYKLPVLGDFAKVTFTESVAVIDANADAGLGAMLARVAGTAGAASGPPVLAAPAGAAIDTPAERARLCSSQPGLAARLLPGLRMPAPTDSLPVWAERLYLTSFSIATYDVAPNAPYPTQVYYDDGLSHMLTRLQLQDGSTEDCILDAGTTHIVRRWPDGTHKNVAQLPVGLPYRDWPARDDATIVAAIDHHPLFCADGTLLLISAPSTLGRVFWIWYTGAGVPVSFLEAPQCGNVQLVLTEYAAMVTGGEPFDPALFVVPTDLQGAAYGT